MPYTIFTIIINKNQVISESYNKLDAFQRNKFRAFCFWFYVVKLICILV